MREEIEELPDEFKLPSNEPFGGLFSSRIRSALVEEFISDPYHVYRPSELSELLGATFPTLRSHFSDLVKTNLIIKDTRDPSRPKYKVNFESNRLIALSLLMDAINDDRDGTNTMNLSIYNYCNRYLSGRIGETQGSIQLITINTGPVERLEINTPEGEIPIKIIEGSA